MLFSVTGTSLNAMSMQTEGARSTLLDKVLMEFNSFEGVGTNAKYQLGPDYQRVMCNLLVHITPQSFKKLQRVMDAAPANYHPITVWVALGLLARPSLNICLMFFGAFGPGQIL